MAAKPAAKTKGKEIKTKGIQKSGKKNAHMHKEDTKRSESSAESIEDIFGALKKAPAKLDHASDAEKDTSKKVAVGSSSIRPKGSADDPLGLGNQSEGSRKRTEEGYKIYSEEELRIGQGGNTPDCPFDCWCCF
mmetsp:Transcript_12421/g.10346  ORF Transcript_12421/g.10346 Transcript_12421/m.10346 type:complete len:134 (-) Transcript_12421:35-436(-)